MPDAPLRHTSPDEDSARWVGFLGPDSRPEVMARLAGAWPRRHDADVVLVHYDDHSDELEGQMRNLASRPCRGTAGAGHEVLGEGDLGHYDARTEQLAGRPADLAPAGAARRCGAGMGGGPNPTPGSGSGVPPGGWGARGGVVGEGGVVGRRRAMAEPPLR